MSSITCLNCNVGFATPEMQRDHYKTDWHRYNLKRRVAELAPVTAEEFQRRVIQQRAADESAIQEVRLYCKVCRKQFNSDKSYDNHLISKKHRDNLEKYEAGESTGTLAGKDIAMKVVARIEDDDDSDIEEVDSDEWDDVTENPIAQNNCIFCSHHSQDFMENMKHMSLEHSFFVPDAEFVVDVEGLMMYLGEKITRDFICIWCNDRGRTFYSLDAVHKHMKDKGHCMMLHEGIALAEYADFYDYSSSYPDNDEGMDIDEEVPTEVLDGDEYQLVLPSGAVIGHRSLLRYYKQRLNPNRALVVSKGNKRLHKVLAEYRSLGWTQTQQLAAAKKARLSLIHI